MALMGSFPFYGYALDPREDAGEGIPGV